MWINTNQVSVQLRNHKERHYLSQAEFVHFGFRVILLCFKVQVMTLDSQGLFTK